MRNLLIIVTLLAVKSILVAQTNIETFKKLGRDSLIKLAIVKIKDKNFEPKNYDRVTVMADSSNLIVEFEVSIRVKSSGMCYYDAISVALVGQGTSRSITGNCDEPKYYKPTKKTLSKIDFVFNAINKKNEIGDIPNKKLDKDAKMDITEMLTYYHIEVSDGNTLSRYKIDKGSGNIFDASHKHYMRDRNDTPQYEIIEK